MKDSTLIILGLTVACVCGSYLVFYGWVSRQRRFDRFFHSHNMFKSTLAMAAALWGSVALLVALAGAVNGGVSAIEAALTLNGLLSK